MQKGIFALLATAAFGYANTVSADSGQGESPIREVESFLKNPIEKKKTEEEEASMRFWTPPIPDSLDSAVQTDDSTYDYIVVGCGSSGCTLASALARETTGKKILVLERGVPRSPTNSPQAMNIWGAGLTLTNPNIAQPFITQQGVRTFAASITGGLSSIDLGRFAAPSAEGLTETLGAAFVDAPISSGFDMPTSPIGLAFSKALEEKGIPTFGTSSPPPAYSPKVQRGFQWAGQTRFVPEEDFPRAATDVFLFNPDTQQPYTNILLKTEQTVEKVEFDMTASPPEARCVYYHATTKFDTSKNGKSISPIIPEPSYLSKPITEAFLDPIHAFDDAEKAIFGMNILKGGRRRVCVNPGGKVILTAGPIHTTTILYNSGVGPRWQVEALGRQLIVEHPNLGQEIIDSVMIPVTGFLAEGPTVPYAGAGKIGLFQEAEREAKVASSPMASAVGNAVKSSQDFAKMSSSQLQKALANPSESVNSLLHALRQATNLTPRSADATRAFALDLNTLTAGMGSNINLGPYTPGQIVGDSKFGILPAGKDPYFDVDLPKNVSEFGEWPDMTLRFDYPQPGLTEPRIAEIQSTKNYGNDCPAQTATPDSMTCSATSFSSFYGGRISEGFTIATRNIFPPLLRDDPLVDKLMRILLDCSNDAVPFNNPLLLPLCEIAKPTLSCLRRQFVLYTTPVSKSTGMIKMFPTGLIEIVANYLSDEEDFVGATRATSELIDAFQSASFENLLQPFDSPYACPYTVLNGFLDLMTTFGTISNPITPPQNIKMLQQYLQDLIPSAFVVSRRLASQDGEIVEADTEKMEEMGVLEKLETFGMDTDSMKKHELEGRRSRGKILGNDEGRKKLFSKKGKEEFDSIETDGEKKKFMPKLFKKNDETEAEFEERRLEEEQISQRAFLPMMGASQSYATFPPRLPPTDIPSKVGKYAMTYMTSENRLVNAYPLGSVVDTNFALVGASGLFLADRGVINRQTRADPATEAQMIGSLAAQVILATEA